MQTVQDTIKTILKSLDEEKYNTIKKELDDIKPFSAHENMNINQFQRAVMTKEISEKFKEIFDIMKLDYENDPNLKDTPMRIASMWVNELMIGRYQNKPRMESFPLQFEQDFNGEIENNNHIDYYNIISKKVDIRSLCSHHLMPFHDVADDDRSYGIIAYVPTDKLLGISKLQRIVNWYGARPQLQEQLTFQIYNEVCKTIGSDNVLVCLNNIEHTCESLRGVKTTSGRTSTIHFGGVFKDSSLRNEALLQAK